MYYKEIITRGLSSVYTPSPPLPSKLTASRSLSNGSKKSHNLGLNISGDEEQDFYYQKALITKKHLFTGS